MKWRCVGLAGVLVLGLGGPVRAADDDVVAPDRPDQTNSTQTVPPGAVQIETGMEYSHTSQAGTSAQRQVSWQATLRIGLTNALEVRLEGEPIVRLRGADEDTGFGDLTLGFKYRFLDQPDPSWWPSLGVQPFVKFPSAHVPIGSGRTDFGAIALASWNLPRDFSLDVNAGITAVGQTHPDGYLAQATASASFGKQITQRLSGFVEIFYASKGERDGREGLGADTGVTFLITRFVAIDAAVGTSLHGRAPDYIFRTGATVRFGK